MIKAFSITILFSFFCGTIFSQVGGSDQLRDSLKHELVISGNDTSGVLIMAELANAYNGFNSDTLHFYGNKALELALAIHFPRGEANALTALALGVQIDGDYPKSLQYLYRALEIAEEKHYTFETAVCYTGIGNANWYLGDYSKTVSYEKKAQDLYKTIINQPRVNEWMLFNDLNIGQAYLEYDLDSSYHYLLQCYDAAMQNKFWRPFAFTILGDCLLRRGDHEAAFNYFSESIFGAAENGDYLTQAETYAVMSGYFKKTQKPDSAIYYANKGLIAANSIAYQLGIYKNSKLLAEEYEQLDVREALHYRKIFDSVNEKMFGAKKVQELQKTLAEEQHRQQQIKQEQIEKENRLKQYVFMAGLAIMLLVAIFLYKNNLQKKKANILLQHQKEKVESTLTKLKATQAQLIQSEKMASLGELTAGIAHEIQNPLNFVNNFSELNRELIGELRQDLDKGDITDARNLVDNLERNMEKVEHHGKRADAIVKGMLQHSRSSSSAKEPTNINGLADEYLRLAYHGFRAKDKSFKAVMRTNFDESIRKINVIPQDMGRLMLNIINNAFYAVAEMKKLADDNYEPTVSISTKNLNHTIEIRVADNGKGIPQKVLDKIFQPFFTTKPTGQGTGLGLSLAYDIAKAHDSEIRVETKDGEGTEFIIQLPIT